MRTQRAKEHDARKGDDPEVREVDDVATIELEEAALATWASDRSIRRTANQKNVGQKVVEDKQDIGNNGERLGIHDRLISERPRRCSALAGEFAVIYVGNEKNVEVHHSEDSDTRERDGGVGYEPPFDTLPSAMDGAKQRGHTLKEQHDDDPWNKLSTMDGHVGGGVSDVP